MTAFTPVHMKEVYLNILKPVLLPLKEYGDFIYHFVELCFEIKYCLKTNIFNVPFKVDNI